MACCSHTPLTQLLQLSNFPFISFNPYRRNQILFKKTAHQHLIQNLLSVTGLVAPAARVTAAVLV